MHPISRKPRFVMWIQSRPWRPNLALLVIYVGLFFLAMTQLELVLCKCNFHPGVLYHRFRFSYSMMLVFFFGIHFVVSTRMTTRIRQIIAVCLFSFLGAAWIPISADSARQYPPGSEEGPDYNKNVTF